MEVGRLLARRAAPVVVVGCESHCTWFELAAGYTSLRALLGNQVAEAIAEDVAEAVCIPDALAEEYKRILQLG